MTTLRQLIKETIILIESISGKKFVVTGVLSVPRQEMFKIIQDNGGIVHTSVKKDTDMLIVGGDIGRNKIAKAQALGIDVITEDEFWHMVRGGRRAINREFKPWRNTSAGIGQIKPSLLRDKEDLEESRKECSPCLEKAIRKIIREEIEIDEAKEVSEDLLSEAWETLPKGWTEKSLESQWSSLGGSVTSCMKKMESHVDNPGAYCNSLRLKLGKE